MSTPFGQYGGFRYESPQTRALGSITVESYQKIYDDQAQFMSKLAGDVSFLAASGRKQQQGIDQANENVIQQFQDFINDVIVLLGGGGDTGFDFGDLRYVFIAIGALFGFTDDNGNITVPLNLFEAAWHFISNYILPVDNFTDAINLIVDTFIATMLDVLGEVPILGQAAEQLAEIISDIRDILDPVFTAIQAFFGAFSIDISDTATITNIFGPFSPIVSALTTALDGVVLPDFAAVFHIIALWTEPFVQDIADAIGWFGDIVHDIINIPFGSKSVKDLLTDLASGLGPLLDPLVGIANMFGFGSGLPSGFNIFGAIQSFIAKLFGGGGVPVGAISGNDTNLVFAPTFATGSVLGEIDSEWSIDIDDSRTDDGTGSLRLICDGLPHGIVSGKDPTDRILVSPGKSLIFSVYVKLQDFVGSGDSIFLQVVPYASGVMQAPVNIAIFDPDVANIAWPGQLLQSESWDIPDGITEVQARIYVSQDALSGTIHFDDATVGIDSLIQQSWVDGLPDSLKYAITFAQSIIDTIFNAFTGAVGTIQHDVSQLAELLLSIPESVIKGILGPGSIGGTILSLITNLVGGFVGSPDGGTAGLSDVFNIGQLVSAAASLGQMAFQILGIQTNKPVASGFLPSGRSNYELTSSMFKASAPTLAATQAASVIAADRIRDSFSMGVISWLGYGITSITAFYINVWKINVDTADWDLVHHSANIISNLSSATGSTPIFLFYELPTPVSCVASEQYAIEFVPVGAGTHHIVGETVGSWMPGHPTATITTMGATRNNTSSPNSPPSTILKASVVSAVSVPWVEVAIDMGTAGDYHNPLTVWINPGDTFVARPPWANKIDAIPCGAGGNGAGSLVPAFYGDGGTAGKPNVVTWTLGTDFDDTLTGVTLSVGQSSPDDGTIRNTVFSIPSHSITGLGGKDGTSINLLSQAYVGQGVTPFDYNDQSYLFGGSQGAYGGAGASPGGAGAGGRLVDGGDGGIGAPGGGYLIFREIDVVGESAGWDTTPPTPPTSVTEVDITFSKIVILAAGATDA